MSKKHFFPGKLFSRQDFPPVCPVHQKRRLSNGPFFRHFKFGGTDPLMTFPVVHFPTRFSDGELRPGKFKTATFF